MTTTNDLEEYTNPRGNERKKHTKKQLGALFLAAVTLAGGIFGAGCSAKTVNNEKPRADTTTEAEASAEVEKSESEQEYADYLTTLSPEQVALRESLEPDKLAAMTDAELSEAFSIYEKEVTVDGKVDPNLYAEAYAARLQGMYNSGASDIEYEKWGGVDAIGTGDMEDITDKYFAVESEALWGDIGTSDTFLISISRGIVVDDILDSHPDITERYHLRVIVNQVLITSDENKFSFSVNMADNLDVDIMKEMTTRTMQPTNINVPWDIKGLQVSDTGRVVPVIVK